MKKFWAWCKRKWFQFRKWLAGVLIAMGLAVAPFVYAVTVDFSYVRATERVDGTALAVADIAFTRLYCDGSLVAEEPGADQDFQVDLGIGSHNCYATHVDTNDQESDPSNSVVKVVNPARPNPPESLTLP